MIIVNGKISHSNEMNWAADANTSSLLNVYRKLFEMILQYDEAWFISFLIKDFIHVSN